MELKVKGHSGCQIDIVNDGNDLFIYKSTYDSKYINRLKLQGEKQINAYKQKYQHIRIPKIYEIDEDAAHLTLKMEYVYSQNFIDYFEDAGFEQISYFIQALKIFLDSEIQNSPVQSIDRCIIIKKFEKVCDIIKHNKILISNNDIKDIINDSTKIFKSLENKIEIPIGECHGDLTFSNILFNGNNYYLIDFLDSFVESPLLDIVKIRQDSKYQWSRLMYQKEIDGVRLNIISTKIDTEIHAYYMNYLWYRKYYKVFQIMNYLRILQYAKEDKIIAYLINVLKSML